MVSPMVRLARGLTDDAPVDALAALGAAFPPRACVPSTDGPFLVAGDQEGDRAAVLRVRARRTPRWRSPWRPARSSCRRRRARRACRRGSSGTKGSVRHSSSGPVGTTSVCPAKQNTGPPLAAPRPEILDVAVAQRLDLKARGREALAPCSCLAALVGRGHGAAGDQILSQFKRLGHSASRLRRLAGAAGVRVYTHLARGAGKRCALSRPCNLAAATLHARSQGRGPQRGRPEGAVMRASHHCHLMRASGDQAPQRGRTGPHENSKSRGDET